MKKIVLSDPYQEQSSDRTPWTKGLWPCRWIRCPQQPEAPSVTAYRLRFTLKQAHQVRVHVTADERYDLFLDGRRIGRGSERGDGRHWFFDSYDLPLSAGPHVLVARVWALGAQGPLAQMSVMPGFLLSPQEQPWIDLLGTGRAQWEAKPLGGYAFEANPIGSSFFAVGDSLVVDGLRFDWGFEQGAGAGWQPALVAHPGVDGAALVEMPPSHGLAPATLPAMLEEPRTIGAVRMVCAAGDAAREPLRAQADLPAEHAPWYRLLHEHAPVVIPPRTSRLVLVDMQQYYCFYPALDVSGGAGASIRLAWAEALFNEPEARTKGRRDAVLDKYFRGLEDRFLPDGGRERRFETLWWRCGRYLRLLVTTADEALTIQRLQLIETRYPLEMESRFAASDPRLEASIPAALRGLQMCAHETYMDCPYYEQLMYAGDTRIEALATYVITRDERLPRKALQIFDSSRLSNGLTQSRYPSRVQQVIPPFALWWVGMVYDYALWRGDRRFIRELMPGVRGVIDYFLNCIGEHGLARSSQGWNFMDWVPAWSDGVAPQTEVAGSVLNWQLVLMLTLTAQLEGWLGEEELAARASRWATVLAERASAAFWDESRGVFRDVLIGQQASEHAQCLAVLSGQLDRRRLNRLAVTLLADPHLERTTIYFSHYLFEALALLGRIEALQQRLEPWYKLAEQGFVTTPEQPEPSRSDCHGWGAHPIYHYFTSILGIRPAGFGFERVSIKPQLGALTSVQGTMVHPRGEIRLELTREGRRLWGEVALPEGVAGALSYAGEELSLRAGVQEIRLGA